MSDEEYKVVGELDSDSGAGVYGHNTATSGDAIGVEGATDSPEGYGLYTDDDAHVGGGLTTPSKSPNIVVYEDDGTAKAVTPTETYTSNTDIFVAAQDAIDDQIQANLSDRNQYGRPLHHVKIDLVIKPGLYEVQNGLSITTPAAEMISIRGVGKYGAYIRCPEQEDAPLVEIDPSAGENANNRIQRVSLSNFAIDHRNDKNYDGATYSCRDREGIYLNDITHCVIEDIEARGFSTALTVRNCWQGRCANSWFSYNGFDPDADDGTKTEQEIENCDYSEAPDEATPAIKVEGGTTADGATANATNHWLFSHLQGGHGYTQHAYMEFDRKTQQIIIDSPNLEMSKLDGTVTTFLFSNSSNLDRSKLGRVIVHDAILGGNPTFKLNDTDLWVSNAEFYGKQVLDGTTGWNRVFLSNIKCGLVNTGIEMVGGRLVATNVFTRGGDRAFDLTRPQTCHIHSATLIGTQYEAIRLQQNGGADFQARQITNCLIKDAGKSDSDPPEGEYYGNAVSLVDTSNTFVDKVAVSLDESSASSAAIRVENASNISMGTVVPVHNVGEAVATVDGPTFRESSGTATVADGSTSVTVTHNLAEAPTVDNISVTPASPIGSASSWHISNPTTTTFDIIVDADPQRGAEFAWQAEL